MSKIAAAAAFAAPLAVAVGLLTAGMSAADAAPKTVRTFQTVTVTPAHVSAQPAAIADKFCAEQGYFGAGAQIFIGFDVDDGPASALFRQITCIPDMRRRFLPHADDLTIPIGQ